MNFRLVLALFAASAAVACTRSPSEGAPAGSTKKASTSAPTPSDGAPPSEEAAKTAPLAPGWSRLDLADPAYAESVELARGAMKALGGGLMKELKSAISEGDIGRGIEVCEKAAPEVAAKVSADRKVEIGRTSFKVRNPNNQPRDFAKPLVDARVAEEVLMSGPDGQVAYMAPIKLAEECVVCHGTAEQIPSEVAKMLDERYPEDHARGFAPGDLRGWFWVELPKPSEG